MESIEPGYERNEHFQCLLRKELAVPVGYNWWALIGQAKTHWKLELTVQQPGNWELPVGLAKDDARLLPPVYRSLLKKEWNTTFKKEASGYYEYGHLGKRELEQPELMAHLTALLDGKMNEEVSSYLGLPDEAEAIGKLFQRDKDVPRKERRGKWVEGPGKKLTPATKCLYRLLAILGKDIKIGDMYKGGIETFFSPDRLFCISAEFWKYELMLRCYARDGHIKNRPVRGQLAILAGIPTARNYNKSVSSEAKAYFNLFVRVVTTKRTIYAGNNFEV